MFRGEITVNLCKIFQRTKNVEIITKSFYEVSITLLPKLKKDLTKDEYYRFIIINIDAKILMKVSEYQIQQCIKKVMYYHQSGFVLGMRIWFDITESMFFSHH